MWIALALISALCLGFYDVFKKLSVRGNDVLVVLMLNTVFSVIFIAPFMIPDWMAGNIGLGNGIEGHLKVMLKAVIVLGSWILGYYAIKHLPLTVQGPINAARPVIVLLGAVLIYGECLNMWQWGGVVLGFLSLAFISRIGSKEGFASGSSRWIVMSVGATTLGAVSALYDKYLMKWFNPVDVQVWFSIYQCVIMTVSVIIIRKTSNSGKSGFTWKWTIPLIALFLTAADMAYFHSLSFAGSLVGVVSMIRRGSVVVSFLYGALALHEKNIGIKLIDLGVLVVSLGLLVWGSV